MHRYCPHRKTTTFTICIVYETALWTGCVQSTGWSFWKWLKCTEANIIPQRRIYKCLMEEEGYGYFFPNLLGFSKNVPKIQYICMRNIAIGRIWPPSSPSLHTQSSSCIPLHSFYKFVEIRQWILKIKINRKKYVLHKYLYSYELWHKTIISFQTKEKKFKHWSI